MEYEKLYGNILAAAKKEDFELAICSDLSDCLINWHKENPNDKTPYRKASEVLNAQSFAMHKCVEKKDFHTAENFRKLIYRTLLFSSRENFDHYMQALEYEREYSTKFYLPRRRVLLKTVKALQAIADGQLDELFISMPPRTGKSTLTTFYYTWQFGRTKGEPSNLYVSYSDMITGAFYNGILEIMQDPQTYKWNEVFPDCRIVSTNAKDETLDINRDKKYHTLTCRSLYGTLNGSCDCSEGGTLIADDLLSGIEEAMNPDRLDSAWAKVDNNMLTRGPRAKVIWVGTRWSLQDPIGRRLNLLETDFRFYNRRYTVINTPALNEKDESNFDYDSDNIRLTTEYFRQRRASFERNNAMCDWFAQYQGEPIERGNTLFEVEGFRYFNGDLPDGEPDRKFMAVDPAFGGGDFTAAPIIYQYGDDCYVVDVVYNDGEKNITQPLIASKIVKHMLTATQIEANKAFQGYVDGVQKEVNKLDYKLKIVPQRAPNNASKEQRILDMAPNIREHFVFLNTDHRSKEYNLFMQNVFSFKVSGKNKHDDAPDALAQAAFMAITANMVFVQAVLRPC